MRRSLSRLFLLASFACASCAASPGEKTRRDIGTFKKDQDPLRLVELGKGFAEVGDMGRAEEYLAAALDHGADDREVVPLLLDVCVRDGRYRIAIDYARTWLAKRPSNDHLRLVLATLEAAVGDSEAARASYDRVLSSEPNMANAHYGLAVLLRDGDDSGSSLASSKALAARHFREYLRLLPNGPHAEDAHTSIGLLEPSTPASGPRRVDGAGDSTESAPRRGGAKDESVSTPVASPPVPSVAPATWGSGAGAATGVR